MSCRTTYGPAAVVCGHQLSMHGDDGHCLAWLCFCFEYAPDAAAPELGAGPGTEIGSGSRAHNEVRGRPGQLVWLGEPTVEEPEWDEDLTALMIAFYELASEGREGVWLVTNDAREMMRRLSPGPGRLPLFDEKNETFMGWRLELRTGLPDPGWEVVEA